MISTAILNLTQPAHGPPRGGGLGGGVWYKSQPSDLHKSTLFFFFYSFMCTPTVTYCDFSYTPCV
jgi:hypothetical protein